MLTEIGKNTKFQTSSLLMKWLGVRSLLKTTSRQEDIDNIYSSSPSSSPPITQKKIMGLKPSNI